MTLSGGASRQGMCAWTAVDAVVGGGHLPGRALDQPGSQWSPGPGRGAVGACPCERPGFSTRGWVKQQAHVGEAIGQGSGWAGRSVVNRALRRREKCRASAHGLRVSIPAGRLRGEPSLAWWLRSRAAPLQGHVAPRASLSAHVGQAGRRRGALPMRGRNSKVVCAACPRPSLTETGLEGAQSCPLRWWGHLDPGGAPPVVGDTGWPWAPRPPACSGLGARRRSRL